MKDRAIVGTYCLVKNQTLEAVSHKLFLFVVVKYMDFYYRWMIIDDLSEALSGLSSADSTPVKATKASKSKANFKPKNLFTDYE